jgi:hypothetical protein
MFEIDLFCGTLRPIVPLPVLGGAHSLLLQSVLRVAFRPPTRFLGVGFPRAETRFPFAMAKLQSCFGNGRSPRKIAWQNEPLTELAVPSQGVKDYFPNRHLTPQTS